MEVSHQRNHLKRLPLDHVRGSSIHAAGAGLYKVAPDCGTDILLGDYAFAPIDQLEKAEEYYEETV